VIRKEVIRKRINKLDEYLSILRVLQEYSYDEFVKSPERYGSVERFLHLAIESILDLGNHIIADDRLGIVNWYSDIPKILEQNGVIDAEIREKWIKMIGFRNVLVHQYLDVDRSIVYDVLVNYLEDIEMLRKVFARYL
jgi:uncharacterized protein YutE (UPF0331/DUF86 family)